MRQKTKKFCGENKSEGTKKKTERKNKQKI